LVIKFDSAASRDKWETVSSCAGDSTLAERNAVVKALQKGDGVDFGLALVSCVGMAMVGDTRALRLAGAIDTLATHFKHGDNPLIFLALGVLLTTRKIE
jgi:hypothetical protein